MKQELPYVCPEHPNAYIRQEIIRDIITIHLTGVTNIRDSKARYYCNECGRELADEDRDLDTIRIPGTFTSEVIKSESIRPTDYTEEIKKLKKENKHFRVLLGEDN